MPALAKARITSAIPDSIRMAFGYLSMNTALTSSRSSCVGRGRRVDGESRTAKLCSVSNQIHLHAIAATRRMQGRRSQLWSQMRLFTCASKASLLSAISFFVHAALVPS